MPLSLDNYAIQDYAGWYRWTVYLKPSTEQPAQWIRENVRAVEYKLHPTFPEPIVAVNNFGNNNLYPFAYTAKGWGSFTINATIFFRNGRTETVTHDLDLTVDKVFIQVFSESQKVLGRRIFDDLRDNHHHSVQGVENVTIGKSNVLCPKNTEVRWFRDEDKPLADDIKILLEPFIRTAFVPKKKSDFVPSKKRPPEKNHLVRRIEIWFGQDVRR